MGILGTKKFHKTFNNESESENQVLKNKGYVSIILHSVHYNSKGTFWQKIFGGQDTIALTSTITYKSTNRTIEAKSVIDKRQVKANRNHTLGISKLIALKVPTTADGLELKINLTAVKDDNFDNALNLMNSDEFKKPLQISSIPVGEILSITNVVKKIFTGIENPSILESTYAGVIANQKIDNPIQQERLSAGYLIMIANNEEDNEFLSNDLHIDKFSIEGDGLKYDGKIVTNTNIIYTITYAPLKGIDESSNWFKKYQLALAKLDDMLSLDFPSEEDKKEILNQSRKLWIEASAILSEDDTYISKEKNSIKATYFKKINERYKELHEASSFDFFEVAIEDRVENMDFIPNFESLDRTLMIEETEKLASNYLSELGKAQLIFPE